MNIWRVLSECRCWVRHPAKRLRWLTWDRHNSLGRKTFRLGDVDYSYFLHPYNRTWTNERAVEVPVIQQFLKLSDPLSTLEVGNVLSHYFDSRHTILDKNEKCRHRPVINSDLIQFNPQRQFAWIVAISTIEHVGWDERPRDEAKVMSAFPKLRSLLAPGGKAVVTIPVGYNHFLDQRMREVADDGAAFRCLKRVSEDNQWAEIDLEDALHCKYGTPFMYANALVFVYLKGDSPSPGEQTDTDDA